MAVRVRFFAAIREAAGEEEALVEPAPLQELLDGLRERYGGSFTQRLAVCSVVIDGESMPPTAEILVPDGAEVALLPPVSGGADSSWEPRG